MPHGRPANAANAPTSIELTYGLNPHLRPAIAEPVTAGRWPLRAVHGAPSYINLLDALAGWRLVREASAVLNRPAAASFKHVSPAGAAVAGQVDASTRDRFRVTAAGDLSPVARAYLRARDADPEASYGDFVAVSGPVDPGFARVLRRLACDGIIAPDYEPGTVEVLAGKKRGRFVVLEADPEFEPPACEVREVFGLRLVQPYDATTLDRTLVARSVDGTLLPSHAVDDLLLGHVILRHTLSNAVAYVRDGMAIGIGAGQQSRIACTRLAGAKVDAWWARRGSEAEQIQRSRDVAFVSDGMIPFRDNVDEAARHGVAWIAEPGGSIRSDEVAEACREHGITLVRTGLRLFQH
jgi:phosphoribosylaminoimidazolecarboxamide formyltransferase / IMP cyclohydrolase